MLIPHLVALLLPLPLTPPLSPLQSSRTRSALLCGAPSSILIREAGPTDVDALTDLTIEVFFGTLGSDYGFNNCRATAFFELRGEQEANLRARISDANAVNYMASSIDGSSEEIIGFVTCDGKGSLSNLAVHPTQQRRGIGRMLVERVLGERQSTVLEVDADNAAALELYASCGFVRTGERPGTRYVVDWWRGRVIEKVTKIGMEFAQERPS